MDDGLAHIPSVETSSWIGYADASVHRIISDLSAFIGNDKSADASHPGRRGYQCHVRLWSWQTDRTGTRVIETSSREWSAIGLEFMGPQLPNGRQAETLATGEPE